MGDGGTLAWLEQRARQLTRGLTVIGFAALLLLALATVGDITGRFFFQRPLHGVGDMASVIMAVIVAASFPACFADRRNIGVDLLGQAAGPAARRWLDAFGHIASLIFISIFAWQLVKYAIDIQKSGQTTWVLRLPLAPWWWTAAGLAVLSVPVQLIVMLRAISEAATGLALSPPSKSTADYA